MKYPVYIPSLDGNEKKYVDECIDTTWISSRGHFVTDFDADETTETIESGLSTVEDTVTVINIPYQNWDSEFLEYMEQFVSVKGNIKIKEYAL